MAKRHSLLTVALSSESSEEFILLETAVASGAGAMSVISIARVMSAITAINRRLFLSARKVRRTSCRMPCTLSLSLNHG